MKYIPDDIKINSLNRDFLLSVLITGNQTKYYILYKQYKEILSESEDKRLQRYMIPMSEVLKSKLMEYRVQSSLYVKKYIFYNIILFFILGPKKIVKVIA